jgi:two-component system, LytTR family, sensor kinase
MKKRDGFIEKAKKYFIDYSPKARFWSHVIFWILAGLSFSGFGFNLAGYDYPQAAIVHTLFLLSKSIISFYIISYLLLPLLIKQNQWILFLIGLVLVFFLDSVNSYYMFDITSKYFEVSKPYQRYADYINRGGPLGAIFDANLFFVHIYNETLPILPPIFIKIVKLIIISRNKTISLERDNLHLELNFLKSQVNPHFLFNVLNSIYSLIVEKDEVAADIIVRLSGLMRYSLYETDSEKVPLKRDVEFISQYVELERIRFQSRANISFNSKADFKNYEVPPMLFISFVENAFKHGVSTSGKKSWVNLNFNMEDTSVIFRIENSKPTHINHEQVQGGIGLINVKKRLDLLYPDKHKLIVKNNEQSFLVELKLQLV